MRRVSFGLMVVIVLSLFAHSARAEIDAAKVQGAWKSGSGDYEQKMSFTKDTYSIVSKSGPGQQRTESGTWKLDGDKLTMKCEKCSVDSKVGKEHSMTVTKATDDALVLQDGPDKEDAIELTRDKK